MTRYRDLEAELDSSVVTARHLRATADAWPELLAALDPHVSAPMTGRVTGTGGRPLPISVHVSDVVAELSGWVYFWCRCLADETGWQPEPGTASDTPSLLRQLALRTGHWTTHPDQVLALAFVDECADVRRRAEETAHPNGFRKVPVHQPCPRDGCAGELYAPLGESQWLPDLVCSIDRDHRVEPVQWSRPRWRKESA